MKLEVGGLVWYNWYAQKERDTWGVGIEVRSCKHRVRKWPHARQRENHDMFIFNFDLLNVRNSSLDLLS